FSGSSSVKRECFNGPGARADDLAPNLRIVNERRKGDLPDSAKHSNTWASFATLQGQLSELTTPIANNFAAESIWVGPQFSVLPVKKPKFEHFWGCSCRDRSLGSLMLS